MKQSEHKAKIKADLEAMGYDTSHDQVTEYVGIFTVMIFLSKQSRVLIETSGVFNSDYIVLDEERDSYSDTNAKKLVKVFNTYINKCKAFTKTK